MYQGYFPQFPWRTARYNEIAWFTGVYRIEGVTSFCVPLSGWEVVVIEQSFHGISVVGLEVNTIVNLVSLLHPLGTFATSPSRVGLYPLLSWLGQEGRRNGSCLLPRIYFNGSETVQRTMRSKHRVIVHKSLYPSPEMLLRSVVANGADSVWRYGSQPRLESWRRQCPEERAPRLFLKFDIWFH